MTNLVDSKKDQDRELMPKLIDLVPFTASAPSVFQPLLETGATMAERLLAIDRINAYYQHFERKVLSGDIPESVFATALELLEINWSVDRDRVGRIPPTGPVVVVANHPFGGVEGLILGAMLLRVRPDVLVLGNYLLKQIVGIRDYILPVNPFGNRQSTGKNARGLRQCLSWLKREGCLIVFPAGEVASWRLRRGRITEPDWNPQIASLIRLSRATVVPAFFPGRNSVFFMIMGIVNSRLRTAMLPRELVNKSRRHIHLRFGSAIPWGRLHRLPDDQARIQFLSLSTRALQHNDQNRRVSRGLPGEYQKRQLEPVIRAISGRQLQQELDQLPQSQCLLESGAFSVWLAESPQIPWMLKEIGRLREITFRQVQEGTGRPVDLDRFDIHYHHLFLWHRQREELVGGYRLAPVDRVLREHGLAGLYTHSLFRYGTTLLDKLPPAIEFGRSFIRPEYQKKYNSLTLIWRGIGQYINRNPQYKILFGPVSISRDYETVSRNLLVHFLKQHKFDKALSRYVVPRKPYYPQKPFLLDKTSLLSPGGDIEPVSLLISEIEQDGKGAPVLLKHYLKLNGKLLSFNVDEAFADVLDGLLMVDLRETDPRLLKRFLGSSNICSAKI